jgi:hypothetical protein
VLQQAEVTGLVLGSIGWWLLVLCAQAAAQQLLLVQELLMHLLQQGEPIKPLLLCACADCRGCY